MFLLQIGPHLCFQGKVYGFPQPKRLGDGHEDTLRITYGSQGNETDATGKVLTEFCRCLQGQARFPHPSHARERHQPNLRLAQEATKCSSLLLTADERSEWH